MSKLFISIYRWFSKHMRVFYATLAVLVVACAVCAMQVSMDEDITDFFGEDEKSSAMFDNLKTKDKIIVLVQGEDPDAMIEASDVFVDALQPLFDEGFISSVAQGVDNETIGKSISFIYDWLPIFLTEQDYVRIENSLEEDSIAQAVDNIYSLLTSASGMVIGDVLMRDPLNIGTPLLREFQKFQPTTEYEIYQDRLFTKDMSMMLMFIEPTYGMGDTGNNDRLVTLLENARLAAQTDQVQVDCIGGPIVAVHNARQIKKDTAVTMTVAMLIIILVIVFSFRNPRSIPLILLPPVFGALFALAMVWLIQGSVSAIALGAGTIVLGISLSYSIHVVAHLNHTVSPEEIIEDLASPLTIGSLTTIGAFAALCFSSSALLQDMGLFAVFALVGTTIFSLVFLPHFIKGFKNDRSTKLLTWLEKWNGYSFENNKWVIALICVAIVICLFHYNDVRFNDNMQDINYVPKDIAEAEQKAEAFTSSGQTYIVTADTDLDAVLEAYRELEVVLADFASAGQLEEYATMSSLVVAPSVQAERIARWNSFWASRGEETLSKLDKYAVKAGFREGAFESFRQMLYRDYQPCGYTAEDVQGVPVLSEWIGVGESSASLLSSITVPQDKKDFVYEQLSSLDHVMVIDRGYFASKMVKDTSDNFNYILFISSLIVFLALLISYGRFELALLAFIPMCVSWVIILGVMAMLGIKFNIINIILATFIFGIGDDFSIFIMDGLLSEYKNGKKMLGAHKLAIFFSAFTIFISMGAMAFAQHPALKSIALISVLGMSVVVLVSYTLQPFLFKLLVTSQTRRGYSPYTILTILNTAYCFLYFLVGCILAQVCILVTLILPVKRRTRKLLFHYVIYGFNRLFLNTMITVRTTRENDCGETFKKPAMIVANHQSFVDILLMLSTTPKVIMMTADYVWSSPFFGWIVRYADFHHTGDGYEACAQRLKDRVAEGYSIVIFPEGTRSADCDVHRFHKGAFYLADLLKLDIVPMVIYGTGQICTKKQSFFIKSGDIATRILPRVPYNDTSFGDTYQLKAKNYRKYIAEQYDLMYRDYGTTRDPFFYTTLIRNYIYKGPVLEWYMRVKVHMDGKYDFWHRNLPREGTITDVGCGYGQMAFMLSMQAKGRRMIGIDYDSDKIELARHSFLSNPSLKFISGDMRTVEFEPSDVFLFNDSLHYIDAASQASVLEKALGSLRDGGVIMVRDADTSLVKEHEKVVETERWSTKIIKFNRTTQQLDFISSEWMRRFADMHGLSLDIRRCDEKTSETLYCLKKKSQTL